jgi:uncharacterized membrane protein
MSKFFTKKVRTRLVQLFAITAIIGMLLSTFAGGLLMLI